MVTRINEVTAQHCFCLLCCLNMRKMGKKNKMYFFLQMHPKESASTFHSKTRTSKSTNNTNKNCFNSLNCLKCSYFVFLNNKGRDSTKDHRFFFLYCSVFNSCALIKTIFLVTCSTHWLNCTMHFQSKLVRIVLACKTSLDSPTEEKDKHEKRILGGDIEKCYKNTVVGEKGNN